LGVIAGGAEDPGRLYLPNRAHGLNLGAGLDSAAKDRQPASVGAGQQVRCGTGCGPGAQGGQARALEQPHRDPGCRVEGDDQRVKGWKPTQAILSEHRNKFKGEIAGLGQQGGHDEDHPCRFGEFDPAAQRKLGSAGGELAEGELHGCHRFPHWQCLPELV
jgi:hypothetical protein